MLISVLTLFLAFQPPPWLAAVSIGVLSRGWLLGFKIYGFIFIRSRCIGYSLPEPRDTARSICGGGCRLRFCSSVRTSSLFRKRCINSRLSAIFWAKQLHMGGPCLCSTRMFVPHWSL